MINQIIHSKISIAILFLIVGIGTGTQVPIKIQFFSPTVDDYGVPKIKDYVNPVVDGVKITRQDFIKKYCTYAKSDTCDFVAKADAIEEVKHPTYQKAWGRF
jgi:hypothetical protein